jgi:hypothetical protein
MICPAGHGEGANQFMERSENSWRSQFMPRSGNSFFREEDGGREQDESYGLPRPRRRKSRGLRFRGLRKLRGTYTNPVLTGSFPPMLRQAP